MVIHMHNNNNDEVSLPTSPPTTGLLLSVNLLSRTASASRTLLNQSHPIHSQYMGSYQALPSGHVLLGHGVIPTIEEYNASGYPVLTAQFGETGGALSYRAYSSDSWIGEPSTEPAVFACDTGVNKTAVYMSWNGATEYTTWAIYGHSGRREEIGLAALVAREGFETMAVIPKTTSIQVEARVGCAPGTYSAYMLRHDVAIERMYVMYQRR